MNKRNTHKFYKSTITLLPKPVKTQEKTPTGQYPDEDRLNNPQVFPCNPSTDIHQKYYAHEQDAFILEIQECFNIIKYA